MDISTVFKSMCRILLQSEIGEANEFYNFLNRYNDPPDRVNSVVSGKEVYCSGPYSKNCNFISLKEFSQLKTEPIRMQELKDIDALLNAVKERFTYAGDKILGNSQDTIESENCIDCFHTFRSKELMGSEHIIYSKMLTDCKFMIGCSWGAGNNFCINTTESGFVTRSFESSFLVSSSDVYYSYNCKNCQEVMFSSHLFSKRYCIGNNVLSKDKYFEMKNKLILEMVEKLKKEKELPSLINFYLGGYE